MAPRDLSAQLVLVVLLPQDKLSIYRNIDVVDLEVPLDRCDLGPRVHQLGLAVPSAQLDQDILGDRMALARLGVLVGQLDPGVQDNQALLEAQLDPGGLHIYCHSSLHLRGNILALVYVYVCVLHDILSGCNSPTSSTFVNGGIFILCNLGVRR